MSIRELIITLTERPTEAAITIDRLEADPRFRLGRQERYLLPATLEARSDAEAEDAIQWLNDLPGVHMVDVLYERSAEPSETQAA